ARARRVGRWRLSRIVASIAGAGRPWSRSSLQLGELRLDPRDEIRIHPALLDEHVLLGEQTRAHALLLFGRRRVIDDAISQIRGDAVLELGRRIFPRPRLGFLPAAPNRLALTFGQPVPRRAADERHVETPTGDIAEGMTNTGIPELAA